MYKDRVKFIMGTHTKTNDQCEYGYEYFSEENYKVEVPVPYSSALFHSVWVPIL